MCVGSAGCILLVLIKTIRVKFAPNVEPILVRKPWMSESIVVSHAGTPLIAIQQQHK
jgi:hypothetical protein